jgi:hypothetical protein
MDLGLDLDSEGSSNYWRRRATGIQRLHARCSAFMCSGVGVENSTNDVSRCSRSGPADTDGRSGSSLPRLNSKLKNSLEIAGSAFVTVGSSSTPPRRLGRGAVGRAT